MESLALLDLFILFPHVQPELAKTFIAVAQQQAVAAAQCGVCAEQLKVETRYRRLLAYMDSEFTVPVESSI